MSRPGTGRRIDIRRALALEDAKPVAPFAERLINANYADRGIVWATGAYRWEDVVGARDYDQADTSKQPLQSVFTSSPALAFDGVNDFMQAPAVNYAPYSAMTIAMVFTSNAGGLQMLMETSTTYSSNVGAWSVALNSGTLNPSYYTGAVQNRGPFAIATSGIHRLIFVLDTSATGTITGCWLNGVSIGSTPAGASAAFGNYPTYIGMRAGTNFPYSGKMGDTLIYSGTMTAGEVATLDAWLAARAV